MQFYVFFITIHGPSPGPEPKRVLVLGPGVIIYWTRPWSQSWSRPVSGPGLGSVPGPINNFWSCHTVPPRLVTHDILTLVTHDLIQGWFESKILSLSRAKKILNLIYLSQAKLKTPFSDYLEPSWAKNSVFLGIFYFNILCFSFYLKYVIVWDMTFSCNNQFVLNKDWSPD